MIVTSRWLGYKAEELNHANFEHFMLQDLDKDQIQEFIQRWHDLAFEDREDKTRKQQRLEKAINESKAIRQLAGNPLLLTMMAILNRTQELPRDRPKLYERASEVLLHQWDFETKEDLKDPELKKYLYNIDSREKKIILRAVANGMQAGEKGLAANLIYREDLERILAKYLEGEKISPIQVRNLTDLIIKQLRYRNFILCSLGGNGFAFVHRTFLEYFCACEFYERFKKRGLEGGITLEGLKNEVFGQHWSDDFWREVLCLLIGMFSAYFPKEIADELINFLIDQDGTEKGFSNIFLAADCFAELQDRSIHGEVSERLLKNLEFLTKFEPYIRHYDLENKVLAKIAGIWQDDPAGLPILREFSRQGNGQAIEVLAQHWQNDPKTLPIIQQQANNGGNEAIAVLAEHWGNYSQTLPIIKQQAKNGKWSAIDVLAKYWENDPETLPIIQRLANQGNSLAIDVLAKYWENDAETLPIIQQQANQGNYIAIAALAEHWRNDPETLPIIQQLANNGNREAIEVLARYWPSELI